MPRNFEEYTYFAIPFPKGPNGEIHPVLQRIYAEAATLFSRPGDYGQYGRMLLIDRDRHIYPDMQDDPTVPINLWYPPSYQMAQMIAVPAMPEISEEEESEIARQKKMEIAAAFAFEDE